MSRPANFKLRKVDLRTQGFDRTLVSAPPYSPSATRDAITIPLDDDALAGLGIQAFKHNT